MQTDQYYIRFYVKGLDNPLFKDVVAWHIWQFCLLHAFPKGWFTIGRQQLEEWSGVNGRTAYDALKRLKDARMLTTSPTAKYTRISILNWRKYQTLTNNITTNQPPADQQLTTSSPTHYDKELRIKNKEDLFIKTTTSITAGQKNWLDFWQQTLGVPITQYVDESLQSVKELVKLHGKDAVKSAVLMLWHVKGNKFAPREVKRIKNYQQLLWNWDAVQNYGASIVLSEKNNQILEA